jgi:D-arginine dehydrogenase
MTDFDVIIVGAGMAGASLAAELAEHRKVLLVEAETAPGYHSTGRSAAFWSECYGGAGVQSLTKASGPMLMSPPPDFSDVPLVWPRGALHIGQPGHENLAAKMFADFAHLETHIESMDAPEIQQLVPGIKPAWGFGVWEPDCCDIDVAALHAAYLRKAKQGGARLLSAARVMKATFAMDAWQVDTMNGSFSGKLLVNATGAWADELATASDVKNIGIQAFRRTIAHISVEPKADAKIPLVIGLDESFYFKANADGTIWLSPHDETPTSPCDAAPEEMDIALAIERLRQVVDWKITSVKHKWAGLRSFVPDRLPVIGHDPGNARFFWLAGQGGFGIQTAPAAAKLAASMILHTEHGLDGVHAEHFTPDRLR